MTKTRISILCTLAVLVAWMPTGANAVSTLFERLGGLENIRSIVSKTIDRTASDPRAKAVFKGINLAPVKESVTMHLCELSGGPCNYEGASMAKAHSGLQISATQFDLMDDYLGQVLTEHGINDGDKAEVAKLLQPLKPEIIEK